MRCRQASELISCHIDGELGAEKDRALRAHLESCPACASELAALRELGQRLRAWDESENRIGASPAFAERVVIAVKTPPRRSVAARPTPAPSRQTPPAAAPRGRRIVLAAGALAAAALLLATGLLLGPADDDPATEEAVDELAVLSATLDPADVAARLDLARRYAVRGDEAAARGEYLRVLAVAPGSDIARAALGLADDFRGPGSLPESGGDLRDRLDGLPLDLRHPGLARSTEPEEPELDDARIEVGGHLVARGAVGDLEDVLDEDRRLAEELTRRSASVARGPEPEPEPGYRLTGAPRVLAAYVARLEPVAPDAEHRFEDLVLLPVRAGDEASGDRRVISAAQALEERLLSVREERPGRVVARNRSKDTRIFVPSGTIFAGRSQDRVTARDVLVRADSTMALPTFCCEEGRPARRAVFTRVTGLAGPGLRRLILRERDQSLVWARIKNQTDTLRTPSRTHALRALYENERVRAALARGRAKLEPLLADPRVVGFVAADGDRILGADVFGNHELFAGLAGAYLESYLVDAFSDESPRPQETLQVARARRFLHSIAGARGTESGAAHLGLEARFHAAGLFAYGLAHGDHPVHVSLFPVDAVEAPRVDPERDTPSSVEPADEGADGDDDGPTRSDPTREGERVKERQDRIREESRRRPKPLEPGSGTGNGGGTRLPPRADPPSRSPKSDFRRTR